MRHEEILNDLNDYVDDALPDERRKQVEEHLRVCEDCRSEERELRQLLEQASDLPGNLEPRRDLWPGIADRLEKRVPVERRAQSRWSSVWFGRSALAAAATVILVFLSVYSLWRPQDQVRWDLMEDLADSAVLPAYSMVEYESERTGEDLFSRITRGGVSLTSQAGNVLVDNIKIVDGAIGDLRNALRADPTNMLLIRQLRSEYRQKMNLIQVLADIVLREEPELYSEIHT